jgi:glycosyltransferase involved in cell wall biosynthesis
MRILFANESRRGGGGVESYLAAVVPVLRDRGHDVALLYANTESQEGPTTIAAGESWSVADCGLDRARAAVRAWRPDVCVSHNMGRLDVDEWLAGEWPTFKFMHGYFGTCVSGHKAFDFPHVSACTRRCDAGCLVNYLPRHCGRLRPDAMLTQYAWAMRQQRLFGRYAAIVVASEHMRREYLRYGLPPDRVHATPLFAASSVPATAADEAGFDVLFLGRLTALKGVDVLLNAVAHASRMLCRRITVVVAGDGPDRPKLERISRRFGYSGELAITFMGWVGAAARDALIPRARLVAVPSIWPEPFGLVGVEAAQHGVPAVAFGVGGISEWLADGVNGVLVDVDGGTEAFGAAIARVLGDGSFRDRLSAGARDTAKRFTADAHAAALESILTQRWCGTS